MQAISYLRALPDCSFTPQQRAFLAACAPLALRLAPPSPRRRPSPSSRIRPRPTSRARLSFGTCCGRCWPTSVASRSRSRSSQTCACWARASTSRRDAICSCKRWASRSAGGRRDADAAVIAAWRLRAAARADAARDARARPSRRGAGRPPYGYRVVDRHLRVQPDEAAVVRDIFNRCLEGGAGVRVIARALSEAGICTRRAGAWSMVSVRGVLRNPV